MPTEGIAAPWSYLTPSSPTASTPISPSRSGLLTAPTPWSPSRPGTRLSRTPGPPSGGCRSAGMRSPWGRYRTGFSSTRGLTRSGLLNGRTSRTSPWWKMERTGRMSWSSPRLMAVIQWSTQPVSSISWAGLARAPSLPTGTTWPARSIGESLASRQCSCSGLGMKTRR